MTQFIGVKKLHTDLKEIARRVQDGEEFVVAKHNQPLFTIQPFQEGKKGRKKYKLKDFKKLQFKSDIPDASQRIDEFVYGK